MKYFIGLSILVPPKSAASVHKTVGDHTLKTEQFTLAFVVERLEELLENRAQKWG
jgi:hypothetical protein